MGYRQFSARRKILFHITKRGPGATGCVALILGCDAAIWPTHRGFRPLARLAAATGQVVNTLEFDRKAGIAFPRVERNAESTCPRLSVTPEATPPVSGDVKGTIPGAVRYHFVSDDVRRHRLISISYISLLPCHSRGRSSTNLVLLAFNPEHFLYRRLGEHRRWSQNGHNKSAILTS